MKIWNLIASQNDAGEKVLVLHINGVIDGGWFEDSSVSTAEIIQALAEHPDAKKIEQHINSMGGSLFGGVALYNVLQAHGAEVISFVDGLAASAASLIAMAGKTVMGTGAMMMIHSPLALAYGDAAELRKTAAVLDKARDALLAIYKAKTGKDSTDLKAMLDAETWMTGEQALRQGFADEIATSGAEPSVEDLGEQVILNSIGFPKAGVPAQILAMATPKPPAVPENPTPQGGEKPPIQAAAEPLTREILAARAPELLAALVEEGRKAGHEAGVAAERERMKAIDELGIKGCADLIRAAKYEHPCDAPALAVAVVKAGQQAGADLLAARERESKEAAGVRQSLPQKTTEADENQAAKDIADRANRRHGGSR